MPHKKDDTCLMSSIYIYILHIYYIDIHISLVSHILSAGESSSDYCGKALAKHSLFPPPTNDSHGNDYSKAIRVSGSPKITVRALSVTASPPPPELTRNVPKRTRERNGSELVQRSRPFPVLDERHEPREEG